MNKEKRHTSLNRTVFGFCFLYQAFANINLYPREDLSTIFKNLLKSRKYVLFTYDSEISKE